MSETTIKLTTGIIKEIKRVLNADANYKGYRKELAEKIDLDTGLETFNMLLLGDDYDSIDYMPIDYGRGAIIKTDSHRMIYLDIIMYFRNELTNYESVWLYVAQNGKVSVSLHAPTTGDILRNEVAAAI